VTNKGIFYEHGKEPPLDAPPKLHLLIESNDEFRVRYSSLHRLCLTTVLLG
jgi:hypothetical protein